MRSGLVWKKTLAGAMALAMALSIVKCMPASSVRATSSEPDWDSVSVEGNTDFNVRSTVSVSDGQNTYYLKQYQKGIYEKKLSLKKGKVTLTASENDANDTITMAEDGDVWVRYQDGKLYDSVNNSGKNGVFHTETLVGGFGKDDKSNLSVKLADGTMYKLNGWKQDDTKVHLDYMGGGVYERTFDFGEAMAEDVTVADGGYKIAQDDAWDVSYGGKDGNIGLVIPKGTKSVTFMVNTITGTVYDSVNNPGAFDEKVQIIGSARNNENDKWNQDAAGYEFTRISDSLYVYSDTYNSGKTEYKLLINGQWFGPDGGNYSFDVPAKETDTVTFVYNDETEKVYDSINNQKAVAYYLGGKIASVSSRISENSNHTFNIVMPYDSGKNASIHYALKSDLKSGESTVKTAVMKETSKGVYEAQGLFFGDKEGELLYYFTFDEKRELSSADKENVNSHEYNVLKLSAYSGRAAYVPGTFPGKSWDSASNEMTYMGKGLYSFTFKDVPAATYEYKIALGGSWDENYGKDGEPGGANISVTVPKKEDVTVLYSDISKRSVTTADYIKADIGLSGRGIPDGAILSDDNLRGIYSATVTLPAGTYNNIKVSYGGKKYTYREFTLNTEKAVTFYFDPASLVYYDDASDAALKTGSIKYDTEDTSYKSIWGAVPTDTDVTFAIDTGSDASEVKMIVNGTDDDKQNLELKKDGAAKDGVQKWSVTTKFPVLGQLTYYFVISNGSSVKTYGDDDGYYGTGKVADLTDVEPYDLIVYKKGYKTPDWMKNAVIYQIFPDRFANGDSSNDKSYTAEGTGTQYTSRGATNYENMTDWYQIPENPEQEKLLSEDVYKSTGAYFGDGNWSNEIYGGDVAGIIDNMDYLKALGVNVIYLNPSFASISSHRYDTSDYSKLDPILGDLGDFEELVKAADENGMHIILDGVFNHVSDDSIYFDRYYKYLEGGADVNHGKIGAYPYWAYVYDYEKDHEGASRADAEKAAKDYFSKNYGISDYSYTTWFDVFDSELKVDGKVATDDTGLRAGKTVYGYDGWWGYDSMPVIKATNGSEYQTESWAKEIIGNDSKDNGSITQYWLSEGSDGWRLDVANEVSDETWQHFRKSVKALNSDNVIVGEIWTDAVKYLLGDMYDSVMNYMFRGYVTNFVMGNKNSDETMKDMRKLRERYPKEAFYAMMNLVDSHDTTRILSYLDGIGDDRNDKKIEAAFPTYEKTSDNAKSMQYLVALMQFTYAGAPTIYYGDEAGLVGADDPDDRRTMPWGKGNKDLTLWYARLAAIRSQYSALRTGSVEEFSTGDKNILGTVRRDDKNTMLVLLNNSDDKKDLTVDVNSLKLDDSEYTDILSGESFKPADGKLSVTGIPGRRGMILVKTSNLLKEQALDTKALSKAWDPAYTVDLSKIAPRKKPAKDETVTDNTSGKSSNSTAPAASAVSKSTGRKKTDAKSPKTGDTSAPFIPVIFFAGLSVAAAIELRRKKTGTR